ncbi:hypothetical protein EC968_010556 [Mortierella alpina]|nr:hypothetical protein EC968_010556 [Mortierella alpina]
MLPGRSLRPTSAVLLPWLALLLLSFLEPVAAQASDMALTFHDSTGATVGEPQTIGPKECIKLNTASLVPQPPPSPSSPPPPSETDPEAPVEETPPAATAAGYASVTASDPQAALNLYSDLHCQILASSAVGQWKNEGVVLDILSIRWEGTAPASMPPGTLNPGAFPPGMAVQTQVPGTEGAEEWVMDPAKGKIVVGLVASVMVIGVAIGVVQVYRAAQYVPPPKKYKPVSTGVVGIKKVKKKDAYFKKPVRDSMMSSASAPAGVGAGFTSSAPTSPRSSRMMMDQSSRSPLMHERSRDSHFSVASSSAPTLAPISSTGGYMDWGSSGSRRANSHNNSDIQPNDSILIDMQDSSAFRRPWKSGAGSSNGGGGGGQQSGSRQGTSSNGRISTSSTTLTDLMQFGHDSPAHSVYQSGSSSQLSSVHPRGQANPHQQQLQQQQQQQQQQYQYQYQQPPPQQQYQYQYQQQSGGRGSDVYVPMQQLEPRPSPPRR